MIFRSICKLLGNAFFAIGILLISLFTFCYFTVFYPLIFQTLSISGVLCTCLGLFLLINVIYTLVKATFTSPGTPKSLYHHFDKNLAQANKSYCQKCEFYKPPRTHHCSICNMCVLRMDHHCPWINNCVGQNNQRYFYLFVLWVILGTFYLSVLLFPSFWGLLKKYPEMMALSKLTRNVISFTWICAFSVFLAVGLLLGFQTYLILKNLTTIEFYGSNLNRYGGDFGYDLGRRKNWEERIGKSRVFCGWIIPCFDTENVEENLNHIV